MVALDGKKTWMVIRVLVISDYYAVYECLPVGILAVHPHRDTLILSMLKHRPD